MTHILAAFSMENEKRGSYRSYQLLGKPLLPVPMLLGQSHLQTAHAQAASASAQAVWQGCCAEAGPESPS